MARRPARSGRCARRCRPFSTRLNELGRLADTLSAFVYAFFSTDSFNAVAAREVSKLELFGVRRQKLDVRLRAWIGSLSPWLEAWAGHDRLLGEHEFFLRNSARRSRYLMSEELESLAAELCVDAGGAFGKLQGSVTSQLMVPLERDGKTEQLPITAVRNFVFDPDPALRERAYRAEQAGWESIRTTVAACLNGVKGTALTLARRRGWPSVLDWAIDDNRIDRPTLDALLGAIDEALPMFRRYLQAKATKAGPGATALVGPVRAGGPASPGGSSGARPASSSSRNSPASPARWADGPGLSSIAGSMPSRARASAAGPFACRSKESRRAGSWPTSTAVSTR